MRSVREDFKFERDVSEELKLDRKGGFRIDRKVAILSLDISGPFGYTMYFIGLGRYEKH